MNDVIHSVNMPKENKLLWVYKTRTNGISQEKNYHMSIKETVIRSRDNLIGLAFITEVSNTAAHSRCAFPKCLKNEQWAQPAFNCMTATFSDKNEKKIVRS